MTGNVFFEVLAITFAIFVLIVRRGLIIIRMKRAAQKLIHASSTV